MTLLVDVFCPSHAYLPDKEKAQGLSPILFPSFTARLVPKGRLNLAQDASPGLDLNGRPSPAGTAEYGPRRIPPQPSLRDSIMFLDVPRTSVRAKFRKVQTSLRDHLKSRVLTHPLNRACENRKQQIPPLRSVEKHFQRGCGTADPSASLGMTKRRGRRFHKEWLLDRSVSHHLGWAAGPWLLWKKHFHERSAELQISRLRS